MALLYNAPRSAEIRCVNQCKLWGVDRITFRKALEEMITRNFEENRRFIENISFFGNFNPTNNLYVFRLHVKCSKRRCFRGSHYVNIFQRIRYRQRGIASLLLLHDKRGINQNSIQYKKLNRDKWRCPTNKMNL